MRLFSRRKLFIYIVIFFILIMGFRAVFMKITEIKARPPISIPEQQEGVSHGQNQAKALPIQKSSLTIAQQKELERIQNLPLIYSGPTFVKQVAITFDDGPDKWITPKVLDILKQHHVRATFFVQGNQSKIHPDVLQRIDNEGHTIGNHSYSHPQFTKCSSKKIQQQLMGAEKEIEKAIGKKPTLFRAPYGAANKRVIEQVQRNGYKLIQWNIDTNDWRGRSASRIRATIQKEIKPGSIILHHSHGKNIQGTVEALPYIIKDLKQQGYQFVTIDEMLGIQPYK